MRWQALLVIAEAIGRGRVGNREIETVAGAHADGAESPAHRSEWRRNHTAAAIVAKQTIPEAALLTGESGGAILRAASIVAQRDQYSSALGSTFGGTAVEPLQIVPHALEARCAADRSAD